MNIINRILSTLIYTCCLITFPLKAMEDVHSYANSGQVLVKHLHLDLNVDFEQKQLMGSARLDLQRQTADNQLILDTKDLTIEKVMLDDGSSASFKLGQNKPFMGQALSIQLKPKTKWVQVFYHTSPEAAALQWLTPSQTAGGKQPFLFTQSQAILARTWVPIQDSPGVRITYSADIQVPSQLMAVMSAVNPTQKSSTGKYHFEMQQAIPSYLLALAVGDLAFKSIGERSGVYAEPSMLDKAAYEFEDTEAMIEQAEKLYGAYKWQRYDILLLPPSFPFGGMENPRLTFATPTILAGDKSLVSLIAHELAHSWSGNLVTNATWNDFWLNEGFTVYFENRIMEATFGDNYARMLAQLGYQDAQDEVSYIGHNSKDTHLFLDLAGRDPDDGMTNIAYEKGRLLLKLLEDTVGRERWDLFLKGYFDQHAFKSLTTEQFLAYLDKELLSQNAQWQRKVKLQKWIYGPGLPANSPQPQSEQFSLVEQELESWLAGKAASDLGTNNWTTHHWLHFLRNLPENLTRKQLGELDRSFMLTGSGNAEIQTQWYLVAIRHDYQPAYPALEQFLRSVGRRKFLKPLYEALASTPKGKQFAKAVYKKARSGYHPVSYQTIDKILQTR